MQNEQYALFMRLSAAVQNALVAQNMPMGKMMPVLVGMANAYHDRKEPVQERIIIIPVQIASDMPHLFGDDFLCVRSCANLHEGRPEDRRWVMMPLRGDDA